jgi:heme A synthase
MSGLRALSWGTVAATYLLIVMGAIVRASGSGLGCPDWPLCYGQVIPPGHAPAMIEYSHRLLGGITGLLIIATVVAWAQAHRFTPRFLIGGAALLLLLAAQVGLGAAVVNLELPPMLVLVHFGMAMLLFASLIAIAVSAGPRLTADSPEDAVASRGFMRLGIGAVAAVYLLLLTGAYVRATGSSWGCVGFPTCNGAWLPFGTGRAVDIQLLHRLLAYAVSAHLLVTAFRAWRAERTVPGVATAAACVVAALVAQIAIGATAVSTAVPPLLQVLHVAGATALWGSTVTLLAFAVRSTHRATESTQVTSARVRALHSVPRTAE